MPNNSRAINCPPFLQFLIRLGLVAIAAFLLTSVLQHTDELATATVPVAATQTAAGNTAGDLDGEVWWTTTDCPAGVQVPCLDPTVNPDEVPPSVADQLDALVMAEWRCLGQVGEPTDGGVYVTDPQLQQCRQYAYTALEAADTGCWVEHKDGLPDELMSGELRLMPAGSTPVPCDGRQV